MLEGNRMVSFPGLLPLRTSATVTSAAVQKGSCSLIKRCCCGWPTATTMPLTTSGDAASCSMSCRSSCPLLIRAKSAARLAASGEDDRTLPTSERAIVSPKIQEFAKNHRTSPSFTAAGCFSRMVMFLPTSLRSSSPPSITSPSLTTARPLESWTAMVELLSCRTVPLKINPDCCTSSCRGSPAWPRAVSPANRYHHACANMRCSLLLAVCGGLIHCAQPVRHLQLCPQLADPELEITAVRDKDCGTDHNSQHAADCEEGHTGQNRCLRNEQSDDCLPQYCQTADRLQQHQFFGGDCHFRRSGVHAYAPFFLCPMVEKQNSIFVASPLSASVEHLILVAGEKDVNQKEIGDEN